MLKKLYLVLLLFFIVGCSAQDGSNIIHFGTATDYPPFGCVGRHGVEGFDVDLARAIAEELGMKATFKKVKFHRLLRALSENKIDAAISAIMITPERKVTYDFSRPYYFEKVVAIIREDKQPNIKYKENLQNKRIACQKGTISEKWARQNLLLTSLVTPSSITKTARTLSLENVDAIVTEGAQSSTYIQYDTRFKVIEIGQRDAGYGIATRRGSPLNAKLNHALEKLESNGSLAKMQTKWGLIFDCKE